MIATNASVPYPDNTLVRYAINGVYRSVLGMLLGLMVVMAVALSIVIYTCCESMCPWYRNCVTGGGNKSPKPISNEFLKYIYMMNI